MWVSRRFAIALVGIACGCIAEQPDPGWQEVTLVGPVRLEIASGPSHVPTGGDGATRIAPAWVDGAGRRTPVQLPAPAIAAIEWATGAAVLDERRQLWRIAAGRSPERIARDVAAPPASRGESLAYAVLVGDAEIELRVRAWRGGERTLARELGAAGLLRWAEDGRSIAFVGAAPGGVAGIWSTDLAGQARCHTNCTLRTGRPWGDAFVPPPRTLDEVRVP